MDRDKLLATTALFRGSKPEEIAAMLGCLGMRTRKYRAGVIRAFQLACAD